MWFVGKGYSIRDEAQDGSVGFMRGAHLGRSVFFGGLARCARLAS